MYPVKLPLWRKLRIKYRGLYHRFIDKYFPDENVYAGKDSEYCATDNWDKPCLKSEFSEEHGFYLCKQNSRFEKCPNKVLLKELLTQQN